MSAADEQMIGITTQVNSQDAKGVVVLRWGKEGGVLTPAEARAHALRVLEAADAALSDEMMYRYFCEVLKADRDVAVAALRDFRALRDEAREDRPKVEIPGAVMTRKEQT